MRNAIVYIMFFLVITSPVSAQWNFYCSMGFPPSGPWDPDEHFSSAAFINPDTGIFLSTYYISPSNGGGYSVGNTLNGGQSWQYSYGNGGLGVTSSGIYKVDKHKTFYILDSYQGSVRLKKSIDGGINWMDRGILGGVVTFFPYDTNTFYFTNVFNYGQSTFIGKYSYGSIDYSYSVLYSMLVRELFFIDTLNGYSVATPSGSYKKEMILKTIDGGLNWNRVLIDPTINIHNIYFTSSENGYAVGDSGIAIRIYDGGLSWQKLNTDVNVRLNSVYFLNDSVGFIGGDDGVILRTYDYGNTWSRDSTGTTFDFSKIFFTNDSIGFAVAKSGYSFGRMYTVNKNSLIGVEEYEMVTANTFRVFPNPGSGRYSVIIPEALKNEQVVELSVTDLYGRLAFKHEMTFDSLFSLDLENEVPGIYHVILRSEKMMFTCQLILHK